MQLKTDDPSFEIKGVIAFSKDKTAIYIADIKPTFKDETKYQLLECTLYEVNGKQQTQISRCGGTAEEVCTEALLEDLLQDVSFQVNNFIRSCRSFTHTPLFLEINALNLENKIIKYQIPIILEGECTNSTER